MSAVEQPEQPPRTSGRGLFYDQQIRAHAARAAATFLSTMDDATEDDLMRLARRIAGWIEGPRRDGR